MYPPATALARYAAHDCYIGKANYFIPKDTPLHVHVQFLHRNPESWTNPHDFIPERWDDDENTTIDTDDTQQAAQGRHPFAYIPFAAGARNCAYHSETMRFF
jgi:cytochrome P450